MDTSFTTAERARELGVLVTCVGARAVSSFLTPRVYLFEA
jgi:hypothetical protein